MSQLKAIKPHDCKVFKGFKFTKVYKIKHAPKSVLRVGISEIVAVPDTTKKETPIAKFPFWLFVKSVVVVLSQSTS